MIQKLTARVVKFFNNNYWLFLVLVVLISYGQILWMQPWEDDSGLLIKLADLSSNVGYFGYGALGSGVYKYTAVPFIPIYQLFGYNIVAYFALLLVLYALATVVVYKVFSYVLGEAGGRVTGFLIASGYVASDAIWRMTNGAATSISFILVSLFTLYYWKYFKFGKLKYYFFMVFLFFVSLQYFVVRDHYLFVVAVFFELIFLAFQKPFKSILNSVVRLVPLFVLFYFQVVAQGDERAGGIKDLVVEFLKGNFHLSFGFLSSTANVFVPDYITNFILSYKIGFLFLLSVFASLFFFFLKKSRQNKLKVIYVTLFVLWLFIAKAIFKNNLLSISNKDVFVATLGGLVILLSSLIYTVLKKNKKLYLFFMIWVLVNVAAYSAYFPTVSYETISRYMSHSFFALAIVYGILFLEIRELGSGGKLLSKAILVYGVFNIVASVFYQHNFLLNKSFPTKKFYQDLKVLLPEIKKNDVLYFDVSKNSENAFRAATSGAMIPNSGTISWRYGVDRYDFKFVTDFYELKKISEEASFEPNAIHSYWYSDGNLVDTTLWLKSYLKSKNIVPQSFLVNSSSESLISRVNRYTNWAQPDLVVELPSKIDSIYPREVQLTIKADPIPVSKIEFPLYWGNVKPKSNSPWKNSTVRDLALNYKSEMLNFVTNSKFNVNTTWQANKMENLFDEDLDTVWQSDRIVWQKRNDYVRVELPYVQDVSGVYWVSGTYNNSVPSSFVVETSLDGVNWVMAKEVIKEKPLPGQSIQLVSFDRVRTKFVRMTITDTLGGDSPMIAEFRVVPSQLSDLDLKVATDFIESPFLFVEDYETYLKTLNAFRYKYKAKLYWYGNKENSWQSSNKHEFDLDYDGKQNVYKFTLPPGGTEINKLKISDIKAPGMIKISNVKFN